MQQEPGNRADIRAFLTSRRARISPAQAGLPTSGRRRVAGLRREEVAVLAGVSTEWYTRLERGHIAGVSDEVLDAVARVLRLNDDERTYLFDLARSSQRRRRTAARRDHDDIALQVQWLLDSMTMTAAFVRNGCADIVASNHLARAVFAPMFTSDTVDARGRPNLARYIFLDRSAQTFFVDWDAAGVATAALLRAEVGRDPADPALREVIGELSAVSVEFRRRWAEHDVLTRHDGTKRLLHPEAGQLELIFQPLDLPSHNRPVHQMITYAAEPNTASEDRLKVLASWTAAGSPTVAKNRGH
ncbi:MAG: helix-turn-helix transcriptional regulator [Jatrophihabitans sp.]|uniref:helix-turn-helix transcriptional regulator n=1 Tax=Jatrophihabitans sp. TaxID=1932789 RepID=UPI003F7D4439